MNEYLVSYHDGDGGTALGVKELRLWIKQSYNTNNPVIAVYRHGKNFEQDHDDIIDMSEYYLSRRCKF